MFKNVSAWRVGMIVGLSALIGVGSCLGAASQYEQLHKAAEDGDVSLVRRLCNEGCSPNCIKDGQTPLHVAARHGKVAVIIELHEQGADLNARNENDGATPLHVAAENDLIRVVRCLCRLGAEVDVLDKLGWTPLHSAVLCVGGRGNDAAGEGMVECLCKHGADVNADTYSLFAPLPRAITRGKRKDVETLIKYGAVLNVEDCNGWRPLHHAAYGGSFRAAYGGSFGDKYLSEIAAILCQRGAQVDVPTKKEFRHGKIIIPKGITDLEIAYKIGYKKVIKVLRDHVESLWDLRNRRGYREPDLFSAASDGNVSQINEFCMNRVDINATDENGWAPLHYAAACGGSDESMVPFVVATLCKNGAKKSILTRREYRRGETIIPEGLTALEIAHQMGRHEVVELLRNPPAYHAPDLFSAACNGSAHQVRELCKNGADVNAVDENGFTALHYAAQFGHVRVVLLLIRYGANVGVTVDEENNDLGKSPLHCAAQRCHPRIIELLCNSSRGEEYCNTQDAHGKTALHYAVTSHSQECVTTLLRFGIDPDIQDAEGETALYKAVLFNHAGIVEELCQNHANVTIADNDGKTPYALACRLGNREEISNILARYLVLA